MKLTFVRFWVFLLMLARADCLTKFKLLNVTCDSRDLKVISVHECEAKGLSINLSSTLHRRFSKPIMVKLN